MAAAGGASNLSAGLHRPPPPLPRPSAAAFRLSTPMPSPPHRRRRRLFWRLGRKSQQPPPLLRSIGPISSSLAERDQRQQEEEEISFTDPEAALLEALLGIQGRGRAASPQQLQEVERAVRTLETLKGLPDPEVYLRTDDPRVSNIVMFSDAIGELKVEAAATVKDGKRILFRFDRAAFSFKFLPFKVPYPVPFRLLGDEAKGWLDTTYLSHTGNIRISRGNKGTTFVLQKKTEPRQRLLSAISSGTGVEEVIDELIALNKKETEGDYLGTLEGEWQLLWASKSEDESWSSIASNGLKGLQMIKEDGKLENVVVPVLGLTVRASGTLIKGSDNNTYSVTMNEGSVELGALKFPLNVEKKFDMELVYIDNKIRVTRGGMGTFVHLRINSKN